MKIKTLFLTVFCALNLFWACNTDKTKTNVSDLNPTQKAAYDYNIVLKKQDSLASLFSWPRKLELDLNNDGVKEEFQAVDGYSRGMDYVLFTKENQNWKLISGEETIPSGHIEVKKLDTKNNGWFDFVAYQPSGRDGVIESYFSWNGSKYVLKEQKEVNN